MILVAVLAVLASAEAAQNDEPGSRDHPMIPRFPGYFITAYTAQDFGSFEFTLPSGDRTVEGKLWTIDYEIKENGKPAGPLQISRNYVNAVAAKGGVKLFEEMSSGGGRMTARLPVAGKNVWMELSVSNGGELYTLNVVEEAALEQVVELSAAELAKTLRDKGTASVYGILFDTGKATIKPESAKTLAVIADVLSRDPALRLEIQGHTDNVGARAANQKLSVERAAAVRAYLVDKLGVAGARLTTAGYGDQKPVEDNGTEAGRAKNRRVELVRK